jgi:DNA-binding transcriptional LysR family regulator
MELRHLRYFLTVAELLNFTKAAAKLRVAQPALSRQIRDLEDEMGVKLLERSPQFVRLTEAGAAFQSDAAAVLARADEAVKSARAFASGERGELRLGYAPSPTLELLPEALRAFQKACPGVRVTLHDLANQEMFARLREGGLDAALTIEASAKQMRGIAFEKLREYPFRVAVSKAHRLARAKRVDLGQLKSERLIMYRESEYPEYHATLAKLFARYGGIPEDIEEHDSATSVIAAAEAGDGVAVVASLLAGMAGPRLVLREIDPAPPPIIVGVAYPRKQTSAVAGRFIRVVTALRRES